MRILPLGACIAMALVVAAGAGSLVEAQHVVLTDRDLLAGQFDSSTVAAALIAPEGWSPYPRIDDREAWLGLPEAVRQAHILEAESLLGTTWPVLPATVFLEFVRTGNRTNYQEIRDERREKLAKLVLGEVFEDEGRFLDDILNGIWAINEETYWGVPAHLDLQSAGFGLPDVEEPTVDLFAAETASLIAWTLYLLDDRLDSVSPLIVPRIKAELKRRVLDPNLERDDFWWMGFDPSVINNWTPWVNSNWLTVVLIAEDDPARRRAAVYKIMRSVDVFINSYPADGGCDEGPLYWTRAGGSLLEVLELLRSGTGGVVDIYGEPLIREMGRFIVKGHAAGDYFINFADAGPTLSPPAAVVHRYGRRIGDEQMMRFAAAFAEKQRLGSGYIPGRFGHLNRQLLTMFELDDMNTAKPGVPLLRDVWLPDIQVMTAREKAGSPEGLMLAAKAGHNEENHNHNDVGSFIVYADGQPVIIDLGPATYTRKTFSDERYTIWNLQSGYHNVPAVNGFDQPFGGQYRASDVVYSVGDDSASISMDIAGAYPDEAAVNRWRRRLTLDRAAGGPSRVRLIEDYDLSSSNGSTRLHFMTNWEVEAGRPGQLVLHPPTGHDGGVTASGARRPAYLAYDPATLDVVTETIDLEDAALKANWGSRVSRIVLAPHEDDSLSGRFEIEFSLDLEP